MIFNGGLVSGYRPRKRDLLEIASMLLVSVVLALYATSTFAQQTANRETSPDEFETARSLLVEAENASANLDETSRAVILYRSAGAWAPLDRAHSIALYRASLIEAGSSPAGVREPLESAILNELLRISPEKVLELLPMADVKAQRRVYSSVIAYRLFQGNYLEATRAFESAVNHEIMPKGVTELLASVPDQATARKVFAICVRYYEGHPNEQKFQWRLADLIARFYRQLPAAVVVHAVDVVLQQAAREEEQHPGGSAGVSFGSNSAGFHSEYDFQLFAVAPALQQLDAKRANTLLAEHAKTEALLKRYPQRRASLQEGFANTGKIVPNAMMFASDLYDKVQEGQSLSIEDLGLEFRVPRAMQFGITGLGFLSFFVQPETAEAKLLTSNDSCPADLLKRLERVSEVPTVRKLTTSCSGPSTGQWCTYTDIYPRVSVLEDFAISCVVAGKFDFARAAIERQVEAANEVPDGGRVRYLATAADFYLRIGDRKNAEAVIDEGFGSARRIFDAEKSATPNESSMTLSLAADAYRRMATLGVNTSMDRTRKRIGEIPDPALRQLQKVMVARALLGVPIRWTMTAGPGGIRAVEVQVTFDQFVQ